MTHRFPSAVLMLAGLAFASPAYAQGPTQTEYGLRVGVSGDPGQFVIGGHVETKPLIKHLTFRPNVEVGFGDSMTLVTVNFEFTYRFDHHAHPWWIYAGGGPAAVWSHIDNGEADFGGGFNFLVGVQHKRGLFAEVKLGAGDSPTAKFVVGYAFK